MKTPELTLRKVPGGYVLEGPAPRHMSKREIASRDAHIRLRTLQAVRRLAFYEKLLKTEKKSFSEWIKASGQGRRLKLAQKEVSKWKAKVRYFKKAAEELAELKRLP